MMAIYAHVGPFARYVIGEIDRRIKAIDAAALPAGRQPIPPVCAENSDSGVLVMKSAD
jgi:hypothetical protein